MRQRQKMRIKRARLVTIVIAMAFGVALGVILQKFYGVGNIFGVSDVSYLPNEANESRIPEAYQGNLQLFILAGQSNMSGRGDLPLLGTKADPRIFIFGNDYHWKLAAEPVDDSANQVDKVSEDLDAGFGPALSFAAAILELHPDMAIGLIPCANGNSSIYEWRRSLSDNTLYGSCLKRLRAASPMGNLAGLLFFQGEADALDPKQNRKRNLSSDQWEDNFTILVRDWRTDSSLPELPIVFAQIGTTRTPEKYPNWAIVQEQQQSVQLPFVEMITTKDLPLQDTVHFTTESYQIIGKRFAEAYLELLQEQK